MTEDETFKRLARITYEDLMRELNIRLPGNRNSAAAIKQFIESCGWNYDEWRLELQRRVRLNKPS